MVMAGDDMVLLQRQWDGMPIGLDYGAERGVAKYFCLVRDQL